MKNLLVLALVTFQALCASQATPVGQPEDPKLTNWNRLITKVFNNRKTGTVTGPKFLIVAQELMDNEGLIDIGVEGVIQCGKLIGNGVIKLHFGVIRVKDFQYVGTIQSGYHCEVVTDNEIDEKIKKALQVQGDVQFKVVGAPAAQPTP